MIKFFVTLAALGLILSCSSSKQSVETQTSTFSDTQTTKEDNLNTETGLDSKKARIKRLQKELENIKLQLEERQHLLEELNGIKKTLGTDSLADSSNTAN